MFESRRHNILEKQTHAQFKNIRCIISYYMHQVSRLNISIPKNKYYHTKEKLSIKKTYTIITLSGFRTTINH